MFAVGAIAGLAFIVKVTSLMLFLGIFAAVFYTWCGLEGFFAFFAIFISIFTAFHLWDFLNVVYPKGDASFAHSVTFISALISIGFLVVAWRRHGTEALRRIVTIIAIFLAGAIIPITPWLINNGTTLDHLSINGLISGQSVAFKPVLTNVYSQAELDKINADFTALTQSSSNTTNEDMGRYFGYETGLNNYLKLPYNLTYQVNQ